MESLCERPADFDSKVEGVGTPTGQTSAIIYTVIESARRRGIDPFEYRRDALTRLPCMSARQIGELLPEVWAAARRAAA